MTDSKALVVPHVSSADLVEYEDSAPNASAPSLATAIGQLQHAIAGMGSADDINFEFEQDRVRTKLRFRAYRYKK